MFCAVQVHVIGASFTPQLGGPPAAATLTLYIDGSEAASLEWSQGSVDPDAPECGWVDGDDSCDMEWGGCSATTDIADCNALAASRTPFLYGGGSACAPEPTFWDGDVVDMRVWARAMSEAEAAQLSATWLAHGVAPPARPPPPPPPEPAPEQPTSEPSTGATPSPEPEPEQVEQPAQDGGGAGGLGMLIPVIVVGVFGLGIGGSCAMRSFKDRRKRDKGVSPYDAGPEDKEGEDKKKQKQKQEDEDFRHVMKKVAAAIAKGEDGGGVAGVEQWSVGALKRWLTRSGVMHNDSYERSELVGRVLQRWLGMTSAEKQSASEAARREMNNEGGAWWRESKEKDATKPAPAEAPSPAPVPSTPKKDAGRADAAEAAKQAFNERADKWFKENHGTDNHGRVGATPPGAANSGTSYAEDRAREREARAEKAARDKMAADKEEAEAWEKEKAKRKATAAEREMEAQAKAAAAAAKQRQEREWCAAFLFCIACSAVPDAAQGC